MDEKRQTSDFGFFFSVIPVTKDLNIVLRTGDFFFDTNAPPTNRVERSFLRTFV